MNATTTKISINRPTNKFGSVRKEIEITFPAMRLTVEEAKQFLKDLETAIICSKD